MTVPPTSGSRLPGQRLRRPPAPDTPLATITQLVPAGSGADGPTPVAQASVQGTLALDLTPPLPAAAPGKEPRPDLAAVPAQAPAEEVREWAARFAQAVVEVTGGDRPLTQLIRWTSARVYADLARRVSIMAQTRTAPQRRRTVRPQVRSVHVFQPGPTSAEVSVHVRYGHRSRALAARLEVRCGRWTCTALVLG